MKNFDPRFSQALQKPPFCLILLRAQHLIAIEVSTKNSFVADLETIHWNGPTKIYSNGFETQQTEKQLSGTYHTVPNSVNFATAVAKKIEFKFEPLLSFDGLNFIYSFFSGE